ncbi:type-F conjugative transfer system mating-pair stabilization protein TraN [Legionella pneumophila]|uniref:type-F conjugative transfer system mating-pair stabilization protein TraN n=1 Tax=Legionella pneumophila TaxID=446 RepID=UPI0022B2EA61|nr:type-F conjugative transfer system mating-pair stabilization protein TraN [Legionella pneumophila]MCZ4684939.1 type-F conjugative transfer system mating-pair stabilization protein TraN [Legionella pneumophila]
MFRSLLTIACIFGFCTFSAANTTAQDFQKLKEYAKSLGNQPLSAMNEFKPQNTFKDYTETPSQSLHYQGVETEKTDLSTFAANALHNDAGGRTVTEHFGQRQFEINTKNEAIKNAKLIEEESYAITHGQSNERVKCDEKPQACEIKSHEEICHTSRQLPEQQCFKKRKVTVNTERLSQRADFEVWVHKKWTGLIAVNLITGAMTNSAGGHLTNPVKLNHPCEEMKATVHSILNNGGSAHWVHVVGLPTCQNGGVITLYISDKFSRYYPIQVALTINAHSKSYVEEEHWDNECATLETNNLCQKTQEQCTDSNPTRVINGLPVTRDCWELNARYQCASAAVDECKTQREKGCLQASSRCTLMNNNTCSLYEQVYRCDETVCPQPVACVRDLFCADGDCTEHAATQNDGFGEAMAPMAVAGAAGAEFGKTQATLFSGHPVQCKIWVWDIIDCCSNEGWADKLHIDLCREEDKALGKAKLNYLAHYVGEFCSQKDPIFGTCLEHKRTYCVFDSKMARIIQAEGRLRQLNPNALGDAEHTRCAGLSVNELQSLDMGRIDFLNPVYPFPQGQPTKEAGIVGDVVLNSPDASKTMDEIIRRVQKKAEQK